MEITQAIRERKSIRGYKSDPIPKETLMEILTTAVRSPSSRNTQPWHITVVTGKALDDIRQGNLEMFAVAAPGPERPLEGKYRERQTEQAQQLFLHSHRGPGRRMSRLFLTDAQGGRLG